MKLVLLLCGKAGAGKDTFAQNCFPSVPKYNFADEIKIDSATKYDVPLEWFYDRNTKDSKEILRDRYPGKSPRDLLIEYAAERRVTNAHYFTESVANKIAQLAQNQGQTGTSDLVLSNGTCISVIAIVADVRFEQEVAFVRDRLPTDALAVTAWIHRPSLDEEQGPADNTQITPAQCDMQLYNSAKIFDADDLRRQLAQALEKNLDIAK